MVKHASVNFEDWVPQRKLKSSESFTNPTTGNINTVIKNTTLLSWYEVIITEHRHVVLTMSWRKFKIRFAMLWDVIQSFHDN